MVVQYTSLSNAQDKSKHLTSTIKESEISQLLAKINKTRDKINAVNSQWLSTFHCKMEIIKTEEEWLNTNKVNLL